jgi:adenylate cyclase
MEKPSSPNASFERYFSRQLLLNEMFRSSVMLVILLSLMAYLSATLLLFWDHFQTARNEWRAFSWLIILSIAILFRTFNFRRLVVKWALRGKKINPARQFFNTLLEVSLPTIGIVVIAHFYTETIALLSPAVLFYFLNIFLTVLRLDLKISLFAGMLSAVEYWALLWYYLPAIDPLPNAEILSFWFIYAGKGIILIVAGVIAGLAARMIKRRTLEAHDASVERLRIEKIFGQQISPQIVEELLEKKGEMVSRLRNVCVMFLDLRNFTSFCEGKSPEEIVEFQNKILSSMIDAVNLHHGIVNQILGDGFMATFGAPISSGHDCRDAVAASMEIISTIEKQKREGALPQIDVKIGLHYGEAVTGNVGTASRKQYSITGNVVITAARLEALNRQFASRLLVSKAVLDRIDIGTCDCEVTALGSVNIKGRNNPMEIFKLA